MLIGRHKRIRNDCGATAGYILPPNFRFVAPEVIRSFRDDRSTYVVHHPFWMGASRRTSFTKRATVDKIEDAREPRVQ
jgi:hypothetical protein